MPLIESMNELMKILPAYLVRIIVSALCGLIIGIERERRGKAAGYRTILLITVGSCLYTIISQYITSLSGNSDQTRIAAQIVTGIGFIGAGAIMQSRATIIGLTTAAIIWLMAAIGMIAGFGLPVFAAIVTAIILVFLLLSHQLDNIVLGPCHYSIIEIKLKRSDNMRETITRILLYHELDMTKYNLTETNDELSLEINYCDRHISHHRFIEDLYNVEGIKEIVKRNTDFI